MKHGVNVLESELIGLAPQAAFAGVPAASVLLKDFSSDQILEYRLQAAGLLPTDQISK
jgi:hypothetical protein